VGLLVHVFVLFCVPGMKKLSCSSVADLKKFTPRLDTGFLEETEFRDFYRKLLFSAYAVEFVA